MMAEPELRKTPNDAAEQVAALPRRAAHAAYALIACSEFMNGPVTAAEVVVWDSESPSSSATRSALQTAQRYGLAEQHARAIWIPSFHARDLKTALEDRFLTEVKP